MRPSPLIADLPVTLTVARFNIDRPPVLAAPCWGCGRFDAGHHLELASPFRGDRNLADIIKPLLWSHLRKIFPLTGDLFEGDDGSRLLFEAHSAAFAALESALSIDVPNLAVGTPTELGIVDAWAAALDVIGLDRCRCRWRYLSAAWKALAALQSDFTPCVEGN